MRNLLKNMYWRLTERVFNDGMKSGEMIGAYYERHRIVKLLEQSDSVCADWAIALIRGEK